MSSRRIALPLDRPVARALRAGDSCLLNGPLFTLRDAGHVRLLDELAAAQGESHGILLIVRHLPEIGRAHV